LIQASDISVLTVLRKAFLFLFQELISGLLTMDDTKRLTADEMLQHPWVAVSPCLVSIQIEHFD